MLKHERMYFILQRLQKDGKVNAASLSRALDISEATIRRDMTELHMLGKITKVHGGAVAPAAVSYSFRQRTHLQQEVKEVMARKALPLLQAGQLIIMDGGSTNLQLCRLIPADFAAIIVTNSLAICQQFEQHSQVEVIMPGGIYQRHSDVLSGAATVDMIRQVQADLCILGVCSLHADKGVSASDFEESLVKQAMVASASQVIALVSADKLAQAEGFNVCKTDQISVLVTDLEPGDAKLREFQPMSMQIL